MQFDVDERLLADGFSLGETNLCVVLLMNDSRFPWFVLVPKFPGASEIYDLNDDQRTQLFAESAQFARAIMTCFQGDKCNVAALGNMVPQLHIHHIVRYKHDAAWPGPIWGVGKAESYSDDSVAKMRAKLSQHFDFS